MYVLVCMCLSMLAAFSQSALRHLFFSFIPMPYLLLAFAASQVTELMERGPLRGVLANSPNISTVQRLRFALDTAQGMAYLHSLGCIHRDLKSGTLDECERMSLKMCVCMLLAYMSYSPN